MRKTMYSNNFDISGPVLTATPGSLQEFEHEHFDPIKVLQDSVEEILSQLDVTNRGAFVKWLITFNTIQNPIKKDTIELLVKCWIASQQSLYNGIVEVNNEVL